MENPKIVKCQTTHFQITPEVKEETTKEIVNYFLTEWKWKHQHLWGTAKLILKGKLNAYIRKEGRSKIHLKKSEKNQRRLKINIKKQ